MSKTTQVRLQTRAAPAAVSNTAVHAAITLPSSAARDRKPDVPMHPLASAGIALVRYIGHPTHELNRPLLDEWAERVARWLAEGTEVYFFCHCPDEHRSPAVCREFQHRLERIADVPPLPWDEQDGGMQQASLF